MELKYEEILEREDLNDFIPDEVVGILGIIFETSRETKNEESLRKGLLFAKKQNLSKFQEYDRMIYHYNLANGWSYLQRIVNPENKLDFWEYQNKEIEEQIINLRLALKFSKKVDDCIYKAQILTNLGNTLSHIGRFSESHIYWKKALDELPEFPMAVGNIGYGLFSYLKILYDEGQQIAFIKLTYQYLIKAIKSDIYEEAKDSFTNIITELEERFDKKRLLQKINLSHTLECKTKKEKQYVKWCLTNQLYLNPLNDILRENIAAHDCLLLPTLTLEFDKPPFYQTLFNQIKQEYVSSRYLLYESINLKGRHFSDNNNLQMDTLDYAVYSFNIEKLKLSYRICYSLFDKIGYLLNDYLKLGYAPKEVSFKRIWFNKKKQNEIHDKFKSNKNWAFRGLFWLTKDLIEKDSRFLSSLEPEAEDLSDIRHFIEHKSIKVVDIGTSRIDDEGLTYLIPRHELEEKAMKIIKLVRAGIIYTSLGINIEEMSKTIDKPTIPIDFIKLKDDYKT